MPRPRRSDDRLQHFLWETAQKLHTDRLNIPVETIAEQVGLSRSTVYRALERLEERGAVRLLPAENRSAPPVILWLGMADNRTAPEEQLLERDLLDALKKLEIAVTGLLSVLKRVTEERDKAKAEADRLRAQMLASQEKLKVLKQMASLLKDRGSN